MAHKDNEVLIITYIYRLLLDWWQNPCSIQCPGSTHHELHTLVAFPSIKIYHPKDPSDFVGHLAL